MSDYGFATYDERTGNIAEKINSKYPIFGPDYANIKDHFRTTHIECVSQNSVKTASISVPSPTEDWEDYDTGETYKYGDVEYGSYDDVLVTKYKHGYHKRPLGYYLITGSITKNTHYTLQQVQTSGSVGGNFTLSGTITETENLTPKRSDMKGTVSGGAMDIWNYGYIQVEKEPPIWDDSVIIPNACMGIFTWYMNGSDVHWVQQNDPDFPADEMFRGCFWVTIDDEYVYIWQRTFWTDHIFNARRTSSPNAQAYQRTKAIEDYAGSSVDVTVYLMPYSMEDLE